MISIVRQEIALYHQMYLLTNEVSQLIESFIIPKLFSESSFYNLPDWNANCVSVGNVASDRIKIRFQIQIFVSANTYENARE